MIEIDGLSHDFGGLRALDHVSFSVPAGEIVGLVGPNGAGKTTLMKVLATLLVPTQGAVRVGGLDVVRSPERVRGMLGYLPERASLDPELLVSEALDYFGELAGHGFFERRKRIERGLVAAELTERRHASVRHLSKGQRQRLALETALMNDPKVLILDEPTDGLDPHGREALLASIRDLATDGCAVLISSHVLSEIERIAHRALILVEGRMESMASDRGRTFRIRIRGDLEAARDLAMSFADTARVEVDAPISMLRVELRESAADVSGLIRFLAAATSDVGLLEVVEDGRDLRSQFMSKVRVRGEGATA